jgi:hypothetical protein
MSLGDVFHGNEGRRTWITAMRGRRDGEGETEDEHDKQGSPSYE